MRQTTPAWCPVPFSAKLGKRGPQNKPVSYDWQVLNQLRRLKKYDNHNLPRFYLKLCVCMCVYMSVCSVRRPEESLKSQEVVAHPMWELNFGPQKSRALNCGSNSPLVFSFNFKVSQG